MFFTLEDYRKIEEYLRLNSKKDTDFPTAKTITDDDYVPIIQDAVNKKMSVEDLRIGLSKGPRGESAYECAVRHGYVGTEEEWLASLDGKSAYLIAVELGYVGTEAEWIASLKGKKGDKGDDGINGKDGADGKDGKDGKDADVWTIGEDDFWYLNGEKTIYKSKGEDGSSPILRISPDGQSLEISSDGGQTWLPFEKNFNKLRVIGYVDSIAQLPKNALVGDIYGVWNPDVYSGRVDEEGHLIKGAYDLYINTVRDWEEDYLITKVYDYDTELPSYATDGSTVLVPVSYLTLDKEKIDGYKVYRFSLEKDGWVMILNTAEIYASKDDIINYGDNVYALVQGDEEHTYMLYRRVVDWVFFGTNASITYKLVLTVDEGTTTNILSGLAVKNAIAEIHQMYGEYEENPEFVRVYIDNNGKFLWGIRRSDGAIIYGAGVPPQIKEYIDNAITGLIPQVEKIIEFLDGIQYGDKTLQELLDTKVDKEEGKGLIDEDFANNYWYEENPEFVRVYLDNEKRLVKGITKDGLEYFAVGVKTDASETTVIESPEFFKVYTTSSNQILWALTKTGDVLYAAGVPSQIVKFVEDTIKPFNNLFFYIDNPEFIAVKLDAFDRILEGYKTNGNKFFNTPVENNAAEVLATTIPDFLSVLIDAKDRIINSIDKELENIKYGGINLTEIKRDLDAQVLEVHLDEDNAEIYTIENNNSTITLEIDDDWNVYEVKDSTNPYELSENEEGEVFIEETINEI